MLSDQMFRRLVRASAIYDLVVTAPFATPWTCAPTFDAMHAIHRALGLTGVVPDHEASTLLFANLMGSVVIVWCLARLLRPEPLLGRLDAGARALFSAWMIYALLNGLTQILIGFIVVELSWMLLQFLPLKPKSTSR